MKNISVADVGKVSVRFVLGCAAGGAARLQQLVFMIARPKHVEALHYPQRKHGSSRRVFTRHDGMEIQ